jgi:hypothetical protein
MNWRHASNKLKRFDGKAEPYRTVRRQSRDKSYLLDICNLGAYPQAALKNLIV